MARSVRDKATTLVLFGHVKKGSTGRLDVGKGDDRLSVFLLSGEVVAATSPHDPVRLAEGCFKRGILSESDCSWLIEQHKLGTPTFGHLLDKVTDVELDDVLRKRFEENLCCYLMNHGRPRFERQKSVFVNNLQMAHETDQLLDSMLSRCDRSALLELSTELQVGKGTTSGLPERWLSVFTGEPQTVENLLTKLPLEPTEGRVFLLEAWDAGAAWTPAEAARQAKKERRRAQSTFPPASIPKPQKAVDTAVPVQLMLDNPTDLDEIFPEPLSVRPVGSAPPVVEKLPMDEGYADPLHTPSPQTLVPDDEEEDDEEDVDDLPTIRADSLPDLALESTDLEHEGAPRSLAQWLEQATAVADEDLEFFSDHDYDRGADDDGAFSTQMHNLDKVDVGQTDEDEVIEAHEAPAGNFSAPPLSEDDTQRALDVANDALRAVVRAFDTADGPGRGRSVVQLLVAGCPTRFALLLTDIQVEKDGSLPFEYLLRNLYSRPPTEQRMLLNDTLVDIIERALSAAADELSDDAFDEVLDHVAGYRQKIAR